MLAIVNRGISHVLKIVKGYGLDFSQFFLFLLIAMLKEYISNDQM